MYVDVCGVEYLYVDVCGGCGLNVDVCGGCGLNVDVCGGWHLYVDVCGVKYLYIDVCRGWHLYIDVCGSWYLYVNICLLVYFQIIIHCYNLTAGSPETIEGRIHIYQTSAMTGDPLVTVTTRCVCGYASVQVPSKYHVSIYSVTIVYIV